MKRITLVWLAAIVVAGLAAALAGAQSQQPLGDYARKVRKEKDKEQKPAAVKSFDNDTLPKNDTLSVVGPSPDNTASNGTTNGIEASAGSEAAGKKEQNGPESAADRQKRFDEWKGKIEDQKSKVDLLARELDVEQREYKLRAASFYGDAGNRLRNAAEWDKEDAQYKAKLAAKQKAVDDAKHQLQTLQEQARKDGVPNSMRQ